MRKAIVLGLALIVTGVALLSLPACKKTGKEKVDKMSEMEKRTDGQTTVYTDNVAEETPAVICLARKLNIHSEPDSDAKTITTVKRNDMFTVLDDKYPNIKLDYRRWLLVETADGIQGWIPEMFAIDIEAYKQLEGVDDAAKTGDSVKTKKAIKSFIKNVETDPDYIVKNKYFRSPDGGKFAISTDIGGFMVTVGYGVSSRAPLGGIERTGEWQYGSKYWSIRTGDCASGGFIVYETESMKPVLETMIWRSNYEFLTEGEIVVWPTPLEERKIEYPLVNGPATEPDYKASTRAAGIKYFSYNLAPCLMVHDFATGSSYMAAAPDLTTVTEADGYIYEVTLKPTETFAANPLFGPVSETEVYKEWVGKEVNGCLSEE